ncbi:MAG: helix-turn-helix transcriptional regulator [Burkholderiales bacterium]
MSNSELRLLDISQVCEKINLCKSTLYRCINAGTFPPGKKLLGDKRVWLSSDIDTWLIKAMEEGVSK